MSSSPTVSLGSVACVVIAGLVFLCSCYYRSKMLRQRRLEENLRLFQIASEQNGRPIAVATPTTSMRPQPTDRDALLAGAVRGPTGFGGDAQADRNQAALTLLLHRASVAPSALPPTMDSVRRINFDSRADLPVLCEDNEEACGICCERKPNVKFMPCGHVYCCQHCAKDLLASWKSGEVSRRLKSPAERALKCPLCRSPMTEMVRVEGDVPLGLAVPQAE